jgi:hypothetical protein
MLRKSPPSALPPPLHRRVRSATATICRLRRLVTAAFPTAALLAAKPHLAEHIDSTPADHDAASAILAVDALLAALDDLSHPLTPPGMT